MNRLHLIEPCRCNALHAEALCDFCAAPIIYVDGVWRHRDSEPEAHFVAGDTRLAIDTSPL